MNNQDQRTVLEFLIAYSESLPEEMELHLRYAKLEGTIQGILGWMEDNQKTIDHHPQWQKTMAIKESSNINPSKSQ